MSHLFSSLTLRMRPRAWAWAAAIGGAALLSGCVVAPLNDGYADYGYTSTTVYTNYDYPPPPRVEYRTIAPSPHHLWVDGGWYWGGSRYDWRPGRWAPPGYRHAPPPLWPRAHTPRPHFGPPPGPGRPMVRPDGRPRSPLFRSETQRPRPQFGPDQRPSPPQARPDGNARPPQMRPDRPMPPQARPDRPRSDDARPQRPPRGDGDERRSQRRDRDEDRRRP